jgi:hypothetical protein
MSAKRICIAILPNLIFRYSNRIALDIDDAARAKKPH